MDTLVESPAFGLVDTFFKMAEKRGFFTLPAEDSERARLEWKLREMIDRLIESDAIEVQSVEDDATEFLFDLRRAPAACPPECPALQALGRTERPDYTRDAQVSEMELDRFTICFACGCVRQGLRDGHCVETLGAVRQIVAFGLQGLGHTIQESALAPTPARSMWARYPEWACLARVTGVGEERVRSIVDLAQRSRIAS